MKIALCSCFGDVNAQPLICLSSVDTARSYHQQLQQDEQRWDDEAKPQVSGLLLLRQLLAQQYLANQLQAEHRQHPEEPQHCQPLLILLVEPDGHDGCEIGAEAVGREQRDEHQPPAQRGGEHVGSQSNQHAEDQQS